MQNILKCFVIGVLMIFTSSCVFLRVLLNPALHVKLQVKGTIVTTKPLKEEESCTIQLYMKRYKEPIDEESIPMNFVASFRIDPYSAHKCSMVVSCPQSPVTFKSRIYKVNPNKGYDGPLDLGVIALATPPTELGAPSFPEGKGGERNPKHFTSPPFASPFALRASEDEPRRMGHPVL